LIYTTFPVMRSLFADARHFCRTNYLHLDSTVISVL